MIRFQSYYNHFHHVTFVSLSKCLDQTWRKKWEEFEVQEALEHISKEEKKDEEDHYEPQNEVIIVDEGDQVAQNEEVGA